MYSNKLVVAVKSGSKVLREQNGKVFIPYGSEYSIYLKNHHTTSRALVKVSIDGVDVLGGTDIVVNPNSDLNLERFIVNGNMSTGNKFKFIEKTSEISEFRGDKIEDGFIRISFQFEAKSYQAPIVIPMIQEPSIYKKPRPPFQYWDRYYLNNTDTTYSDTSDSDSSVGSSSILRSRRITSSTASASAAYVNQLSIKGGASAQAVTDGITVHGSKSNQQFKIVESFDVDSESFTIMLKLVGEVESKKIEKPVLTKTTIQCKTCGQFNKSNHKFCSRCGTSVNIF